MSDRMRSYRKACSVTLSAIDNLKLPYSFLDAEGSSGPGRCPGHHSGRHTHRLAQADSQAGKESNAWGGEGGEGENLFPSQMNDLSMAVGDMGLSWIRETYLNQRILVFARDPKWHVGKIYIFEISSTRSATSTRACGRRRRQRALCM